MATRENASVLGRAGSRLAATLFFDLPTRAVGISAAAMSAARLVYQVQHSCSRGSRYSTVRRPEIAPKQRVAFACAELRFESARQLKYRREEREANRPHRAQIGAAGRGAAAPEARKSR